MLARNILGLTLALAGGALACGGEEERPRAQPDSGAHDDLHEEDDVIPCPTATPKFEIGMTVAGEDGRIHARLVSAAPVSPRKFENRWVLQFVDAAGEPIPDIRVDPKEPWMDIHGHGGGYPPVVATTGMPGELDFDQVNLRMSGPWRVNFNASSATAGEDVVIFNVCVP